MKKKSKTKSKLAKEITRYADQILYGSVLSIDPSSGSSGSLPGYSRWESGRLIESGTLRIPPGTRNSHSRLHILRNVMSGLVAPDILIVEAISPGMGAHMISKSLLHACGVIISTWDIPVLEVAPMTWKARIDKEKYLKSDAADAVSIYCAARQVLQEELNMPVTPMIYLQDIKHG